MDKEHTKMRPKKQRNIQYVENNLNSFFLLIICVIVNYIGESNIAMLL